MSTVTTAGTSATQVSSLVVPGGSAPSSGVEYSVTLNGTKQSVSVGNTVNGFVLLV